MFWRIRQGGNISRTAFEIPYELQKIVEHEQPLGYHMSFTVISIFYQMYSISLRLFSRA
jgi:hypothetical protein